MFTPEAACPTSSTINKSFKSSCRFTRYSGFPYCPYPKSIRRRIFVFLTFSAADMQWPDLHKHFLGYSRATDGDYHMLRELVWDGVQNQPHIVAHYLLFRFEAFVEHVLKPFLGYESYDDFWWRFEWQLRGSGHLYFLF